MTQTKIGHRIEQCIKIGLTYSFDWDSMVKDDFNLHSNEIRFDSDEVFNEKINRMKVEMERRKNND